MFPFRLIKMAEEIVRSRFLFNIFLFVRTSEKKKKQSDQKNYGRVVSVIIIIILLPRHVPLPLFCARYGEGAARAGGGYFCGRYHFSFSAFLGELRHTHTHINSDAYTNTDFFRKVSFFFFAFAFTEGHFLFNAAAGARDVFSVRRTRANKKPLGALANAYSAVRNDDKNKIIRREKREKPREKNREIPLSVRSSSKAEKYRRDACVQYSEVCIPRKIRYSRYKLISRTVYFASIPLA